MNLPLSRSLNLARRAGYVATTNDNKNFGFVGSFQHFNMEEVRDCLSVTMEFLNYSGPRLIWPPGAR